MIKAKINQNGRCEVSASGTTHEITAQTAALIKIIHNQIAKQDGNNLATLYKNVLIGVLLDPESPVWKVEDNHG